ncbi:hypothetical protein [uncultured Friedmanniella sp.]|uniref:arsenate reductase/protein-tyrosine-phosphatase family protein n=1 Tax=uncultured Friedmanniella sp. TaxID=335381 RepID=UPI0035C977D9
MTRHPATPSSADWSGPGTDAFAILCVCTGNICRSPAAERLLAARLGPDVVVSSAGTRALVGQPISPPMDILIAEAGGDPGGFTARRLTERLLAPADLVLALTTAHRGEVVDLWPKAVRRAFTLKELARLLGAVDAAALPAVGVGKRLRAALPLASAQRRPVRLPGGDDVADPYRRGADAYARSFAEIEEAVAVIAAVLVP